jgi:hypothetical protein
LEAVVRQVAAWFPKAAVPAQNAETTDASWDAAYAADPAGAYRAVPESFRAVLDHRLWGDAVEQALKRRSEEDPKGALPLAERAEGQLPDRPQVAQRLYELGLKTASANVSPLRLAEIEALQKTYREKLRRPDEAFALARRWLDDQRRKSLSPTDAEGRIALANQYETLLNDKAASTALLQEAWKIDPHSRELADIFLRKGFRKVNDAWVEPDQPRLVSDDSSADAGNAPKRFLGRALRGKTRKEVRVLLGGPPTQVTRSASQGQIIEQWTYTGAQTVQYINFLQRGSEVVPTVVSYYSLPRSLATAP